MYNKITALYERSAHRNPESIREQMTILEAGAKSPGLMNFTHFTDDGYSAFDDDRPGFSALCAAVSSVVTNPVGYVFIFGAVCGRITHMQEATVWSIAVCGIVILLMPLIIKGLLEIVLRIPGPLLQIMVR